MKPKQGKLKICLLAVVMITVAPISIVRPEAIFTKEAPLVWAKVDEQTSSGSYQLTLALQLDTPCRYLHRNEISWCEREFDEQLFHPLQDLCTEAGPFEDQTKNFDYVGTVVLGIASQLLSNETVDTKRVSDLESEIYSIDKKISLLNEAISEAFADINEWHYDDVDDSYDEFFIPKQLFKRSELSLRKMEVMDEMTKFNRNMTTLNESVREWHKSVDGTGVNQTEQIGKFADYVYTLENRMVDFSRSWREGVLSDEFFNIFMMTRSETIFGAYRGTKPKSCRYSKETKLAVFHFTVFDPVVVILEARPFQMYRHVPHTDNVELLTYHGPRNIFYLARNQCTVLFDKRTGNMPSSDNCHMFKQQHSFKDFWINKCGQICRDDCSMENVAYTNDAQIEQMGNKFFIYCYGHHINIHSELQPCPNYVFSIHIDEPFQISKFRIDGLLKDQNDGNSDYLYGLNRRIFSTTSQMDLDNIPVTNVCPSGIISNTSQMDLDNIPVTNDGPSEEPWNILAYAIIGLLVIAFSTYLWIRMCGNITKDGSSVNKSQLKNEKEIRTSLALNKNTKQPTTVRIYPSCVPHELV